MGKKYEAIRKVQLAIDGAGHFHSLCVHRLERARMVGAIDPNVYGLLMDEMEQMRTALVKAGGGLMYYESLRKK